MPTAQVAPSATSQAPQHMSLSRVAVLGDAPEVLTDIYRDDVNLCLWQRTTDPRIDAYVQTLLQPRHVGVTWQAQQSARSLAETLCTILPAGAYQHVFIQELILLADMFETLLGQAGVGVRMSAISTAMCPRFHVDRVPCRLVTTLGGPGTEWIPNSAVNRDKLGHRSQGQPDEQSGLISSPAVIQRMAPQHVGLMKGERWPENEGGGLVHRSPALKQGEARLVITLDVIG